MKTIAKLAFVAALLTAAPFSLFAASHSAAPASASSTASPQTEGEVRKVDKDAKKITIRHAALKHLEMPAMTMVFQVKDPSMLSNVKQGDKVNFVAEKLGGEFTVTQIEPRQ